MAAPPTLRATLRRALMRSGAGVVLGTVTGALLTLTGPQAVAGLLSPESATAEMAEAVEASEHAQARHVRRVARLSGRYDCSTEGLAEGVIPARAIVRADGAVRLASFDEGWAMHEGRLAGTLVAVCAR